MLEPFLAHWLLGDHGIYYYFFSDCRYYFSTYSSSMKPTVHFNLSAEHSVNEGGSAWVFPIDHPSELVSNTKLVRTSKVLSLKQVDGNVVSFDTENTHYVGVLSNA